MSNKIKKAYQSVWKINVLEEELHHFMFLYERNEMITKYYLPLLNTEAYKGYINEIKGLLRVKEPEGVNWIRVGQHHDGGYVMVDDLEKVKCAYSIGICDDISWDEEFNRITGAEIYMYDHTIDKLPYTKEGVFHWYKYGIGGSDREEKRVLSLETMINDNGHKDTDHMILKIDVEGAEWESLAGIDPTILKHFDQILMEMHNIHDINERENIVKSLNNLNAYHQLVHVHANNNEAVLPLGDWNLPMALEVVYLNKERFSFKESKRFFPTDIDEPNNPSLPDVPLGFWS